jgi:hypothetical protein
MSVENQPERPTEEHYARLARHRANGWSIDDRRDGFLLFSALKRPTETSLIYLVASSIPELVRRLDAIEQAEEAGDDR